MSLGGKHQLGGEGKKITQQSKQSMQIKGGQEGRSVRLSALQISGRGQGLCMERARAERSEGAKSWSTSGPVLKNFYKVRPLSVGRGSKEKYDSNNK